jgi:hypothetical protein
MLEMINKFATGNGVHSSEHDSATSFQSAVPVRMLAKLLCLLLTPMYQCCNMSAFKAARDLTLFTSSEGSQCTS